MNTSSRALVDQVRAFIDSHQQIRDELQTERAALEARRESLQSMPLCRDDIKQFVCDYIDARAAEYPKLAGWGSLFEKVAYPLRYGWASSDSVSSETGKRAPLCLRDVDEALGSFEGDQRTFENGLQFFGAASTVNTRTDYAAYFFFGDLIKARIVEHFDALCPNYHPADASRIGPPIAERRAELERLAKAISGIDDELTRITAELAELSPRSEARVAPSAKPAAGVTRSVPEEAILRYNGRNEAELARKYGCSAAAILAAWHAAERKRVASPSGQGINGAA